MMRLYQGAVFFDADGTLFDKREGITEPTSRTKEAILRLREKGYLVGLASGRAKCYVPACLLLFDCYITSNGAHAEVGGKTVADSLIGEEALGEVAAFLEAQGINYVVEGQNICYVKDIRERWYRHMMENYNFSDRFFFPLTGLGGLRANKLMVAYDRLEKLEYFRARYGAEYDITEQPGNQASDVGKRGISKGYGVRAVLDTLGIPLKSAYAFGDADNDLDMLRTVGHPVAMGGCTPAVRAAAEFVTGTVPQEGICQGLARLGLL